MTTRRLKFSCPLRLSLARRALVLSLAVGLLILLALDLHIRTLVRHDFQKQLIHQLQIQANEGRLRFDAFVKGHSRLANIIAGQKRFDDYFRNHDQDHPIERFRRPPPWLPPLSMLRQLTRAQYFIIVDPQGRTREYYCACKAGLPKVLRQLDPALLRVSRNENFMTMLGGRPFLLSSAPVPENGGSLVLATEIDDTLLISMLPPYQTGDQVIALVSGFVPKVLASSDPRVIPPGSTVKDLKKDFLYFGATVFNYEYADMLITYAHFLPRTMIGTLAAPRIRRQRLLLVAVALLYTAFFLAVILWIAHQIAVVTREITAFSEQSLGANAPASSQGSEIDILREHFRLFAAEVQSSSRRQAALLQTVLDAMPAPLFYKGRDGRYQGCNQAFADFLGKRVDEVIGSTVYDVAPKDLADIYYRADKELMTRGGKQVYETEIVYADGSRHDVVFHKATYHDDNGKVTGMVGLMLDITERNRAEAERQKMEAKLVQAQKMESIGTLAGGIAHDFNNILAAILGYTELALLEIDETHPIHDHLETVLASGNRARDLVRQILTFSRQSEHEKKPLLMAPIVKEALKLLRASVPTTIDFQVDICPDCGHINGDPIQIHQVVMNLCTNAYHAMREHGGRLSVSLKRVTEPAEMKQRDLPPGSWLRLTVADTGKGMDEETLERIFEPYFTTKKQGEGTGLGLAVVHGIVMDHEGRIFVESAPGRGTTFTLYFPELHHDDDDGQRQQGALMRGSGRILAVDDEENILGMLAGILNSAGYEVTPYLDPRDAWDAFDKQPEAFDLVITDMTMPGMTGFDFARKVLARRPEIPVILCTGFSEAIGRKEALAAGIAEFLTKPIGGHELAAVIHRLLAGRASRP